MFFIECPGNFQEFQGSCYSISVDTATWDDAQSNCNQLGNAYGLVIIQDKSEQDFLNTILRGDTSEFWIGLKKSNTEGSYKWIDGSSLTYGSDLEGDPWKTYSNGRQEPNGVITRNFLPIKKFKFISVYLFLRFFLFIEWSLHSSPYRFEMG